MRFSCQENCIHSFLHNSMDRHISCVVPFATTAPEQESEYRRLHNLDTRAELTQAAKDFLEVYRKQGNRTNPCSSPLGQEEIMSLAHRGVEAGISRAKFEHWVPFNFVAAPEDQPVLASRGSAEFSQREALRRHTLAVVCSGIGMQTTSKSEDSSGCVFVPPRT